MKKQAAIPNEPQINLSKRILQLSAKRQEIIRPILEHPRGFVLLSIRALAKRLNTDPATIVRIVQGLGFSTYRDFQRHLHDLSIAFATSADTMASANEENGIPSGILGSLELDIKNLQGMKNSVDVTRFTDLARRMHEARRIVVISGDLASVLGQYIEYQLTLLGLPIMASSSAGRILHLTRSLTKQDVLIAISFRRGLRQTVEGAQQARDSGAHCVAITDTYLSPLARICQETLLATVESTTFGASYAAPIALLNAVLAACGQYKHAQTMAVVKEISEEQRRGSRWHQE